ncbi:MAG: WbuC family cupin fold metalloprotein [Chloroflexota bacterium]
MRTINQKQLDDLIAQAAQSQRKRTIYRLHEHDEPVQRMINAVVPGTYVTPHEHSQPPKVELLTVLRGQIAVLKFAPDGTVHAVHILAEDGPLHVVDIAPGEIHSMVALAPSAVLEIVQGPYDPVSHKQFAPFAPAEGQPGTEDYLSKLHQIIAGWPVG